MTEESNRKQKYGDIVKKLTQTQKNDLAEAFDIFDVDGDGTVSSKELGSLFRCFGARKSPSEIEEILLKFDEDGSGEIEFDEFVAMMADTILEPDVDPELLESYRVFDRNDGGISP